MQGQNGAAASASAIDDGSASSGTEQAEQAEPAHHHRNADTYGSCNAAPARGSSQNTRLPTTSKTSPRVLAPDLARGLLMALMAFDHASVVLHTWGHGTGRDTEADGRVVRRWNFATAYVVRTLTHLCAPGFTFLLGMGVVYLGRSRTRLGWRPARLAGYFAVRCAVLTVVTAVFGFVVTGGRVFFMNAVLFALAVDYLLAGLLWLAVERCEGLLTRFLVWMRKTWARGSSDEASAASASIAPVMDADDDDETIMQPLLLRRSRDAAGASSSTEAYISRTVLNAALLAMAAVSILWNIWLSDDGGACASPRITAQSPANPLLRIWFWTVERPDLGVISGFPPLAWLSFAILGLLYGRIITAGAVAPTPRTICATTTTTRTVLAHVAAALLFALLFLLTRLLQLGNLSTGCLRTPDQDAHPSRNPYLASPASFFYIVKYPPDVAFLAFTMAGNLLILAAFTALPLRLARRLTMLLAFGTSALFFYVMHMLVLFALGTIVVALFGHDTGVPDPLNPDEKRGVDSLLAYFAFWALVMLIMWPACRWYSRFKSGKGPDSVWRFF